MYKYWKKISYLGITPDQDFRLERRIILSNRFALLIAAVTLIFLVAFLFRPNASILPLIGMLLVAGSIWFFNSLELTGLSRFITCLIPGVGLFVLNISQKFGDPSTIDILHYATPRMIIVGSAALPFAMFTASEKRLMVGAVSLIILLGFGYNTIHELLGIDVQSLGINDKYYSIVSEDVVVLTIIILAACGFLFSMGDQYDRKAKGLLDDALQQTESLKKNEENLRKTLSELEEARKKDDSRSWVAKGVAELGTILQSADDTENIYETWLSSVIKYLKVNQGGLFLVEENGGKVELQLAASYAYERKKFLQKSVAPGEGLVGQAYIEKHIIYLKKVPKDYIHITSGLGDAPPHVLMVLPVKTTQSIEAVLEIASFHELEEHHRELLEKLGESLASFISNHKINQRTKKLLQQAQTMSEELRSNEEEMRQNLEELTATQEALARKEREYQHRIAELEEALSAARTEAVEQA
ncbi:MAG TPA: GAF domain-containing protein [Ohtaekwangia sp.]|uniref:GAF domain-containing protein n=1 Tax=Ohtaekwangia sp. TaxID=2066019 RepID=UPI002F952A13